MQSIEQFQCGKYLVAYVLNTFENRADPDQADLQELPEQGLLRLLLKYMYDISDSTQLDLIKNFVILCTNMKVYLYNYS